MPLIGLQIRYNKVRSLMHMAKKDSLTELSELPYIKWTSQKLGLSNDELNDIANGEKGFSAPFSNDERIDLLYELMKLFYTDKQVVKTEIKKCAELAEKMDLKTKSVNDLMKRIKDNANKLIAYKDFNAVLS